MHDGYLGRQMPQLQMSPLSPHFPELLIWTTRSDGKENPCGQFGSSILPVSPPTIFHITTLLALGEA